MYMQMYMCMSMLIWCCNLLIHQGPSTDLSRPRDAPCLAMGFGEKAVQTRCPVLRRNRCPISKFLWPEKLMNTIGHHSVAGILNHVWGI